MKIEVYVSTGYIGCRKTEVIEIPDGLTEDEIDEYARDAMFEMIEWNWKEVE